MFILRHAAPRARKETDCKTQNGFELQRHARAVADRVDVPAGHEVRIYAANPYTLQERRVAVRTPAGVWLDV